MAFVTPLRWVGRVLITPVRWLARLLAAPARLLHRGLAVLAQWLARVPDWWWAVLSSIYWWARPGVDLPYQLIARLLELLLRGAVAAARWATAPARRLWPATRAVATHVLGHAERALRWLGRAIVGPLRWVGRGLRFVSGGAAAAARRLAWPVRAGARGARSVLRRADGPWQRLRGRMGAVGARLSGARARIAARLSRRVPELSEDERP